MSKNFALNPKLTALLLIGIIGPIFIIILMKRSYEFKKAQLDQLNEDLKVVNFVQEISTELFSVEYALKFVKDYDTLPTVYVVTTLNNSVVTRLADLNRFSNTLRLVPKLVWIIVEDSPVKTRKLENFLPTLDMNNIVHLNFKTPDESLDLKNKSAHFAQRNWAIKWLRQSYADGTLVDIKSGGVVYFAEAEHTYDIRIFEEMRSTKKVSVWPIALVREDIYQGPICNDQKVVDWYCGQSPCPLAPVKFPIEINAFAINLDLIVSAEKPYFPYESFNRIDDFLKGYINSLDDLEPRSEMCSKLYVWNTHTSPPNLPYTGVEKLYNINYEEFMLEQI